MSSRASMVCCVLGRKAGDQAPPSPWEGYGQRLLEQSAEDKERAA